MKRAEEYVVPPYTPEKCTDETGEQRMSATVTGAGIGDGGDEGREDAGDADIFDDYDDADLYGED